MHHIFVVQIVGEDTRMRMEVGEVAVILNAVVH